VPNNFLRIDVYVRLARDYTPREDDFVFATSALHSLFGIFEVVWDDGGANVVIVAVVIVAIIFVSDEILVRVEEMGEDGGRMRESNLPSYSALRRIEMTTV